jgi:hypothetical protein
LSAFLEIDGFLHLFFELGDIGIGIGEIWLFGGGFWTKGVLDGEV